jgi:antitoxin component YwqK of YwqJK toxin-antitoxin module
MKTAIKTSALLFAFALLSTGVFAANKAKTDSLTNQITASVNYYNNTCGIDVSIDNATNGDAAIMIYNPDGKLVMDDKFTLDTDKVQKNYLMDGLAEGDYTVKVASASGVVKQVIKLSSQTTTEQQYAF